MSKIIISISELNEANWALIYKFINAYYDNDCAILNVLNDLEAIATINLAVTHLEMDTYSVYGNKLLFENLPLSSSTMISLIYKKKDNKEDFSNLVPFFLLKQKFEKKIALGIDIGNITNYIQQVEYIFKCSDFLRFIEDKKPLLGKRSIYFINAKEKVKNNGKIKNFSPDNVTSLIGKKISNNKNYLKDNDININSLKASRRYLPLLKINKNNFIDFFKKIESFDENDNCLSDEVRYIKESIEKISLDLKANNILVGKDNYNSLLEEWFIKAYFYSLGNDKINMRKADYESLICLLRSYYNNIYELVQNIIYHGGKKGILYIIFNKKKNITTNQKMKIPNFDKYKDSNQRFIEIGIFDFYKKGIVETYVESYKQNTSLDIKDFFDPKSIRTTGLDHLDLRYLAHLGIKSFVKSIYDHKGYFRVESSFGEVKHGVESIANTKNSPEQMISKLEDKDFVSGTHYKIILPVYSTKKYPNILIRPQTQKKSNIEKFRDRLTYNKVLIKHYYLADVIKDKYVLNISLTKEEQKHQIESIGKDFINIINLNEIIGNEIAINITDLNIDLNFIFKLLSFIQLSSSNTFEKIILTHLSDDYIQEFCGLIQSLLINPKIKPIWSNKSALILVSNSLRYQIICGETTSELYYLNNEFQKYYYAQKNFFPAIFKIPRNGKDLDKFLLPYEVLISKNNSTYFEQYISKLLREPIESNKMGYLVSNNYTYIGSKLIVKNFFEADSMFQNSFFTERFAYLISRDIRSSRCIEKSKKNCIISYKPYSGLLAKTIKKLIPIETVIIANEGNPNTRIEFDLDRDKNYEGKDLEENIRDHFDDYRFITLVPIGSTLSTNDKIIAFFKLFINKNNSLVDLIPSRNFIYNHCVILVRDRIGKAPTLLEKEQKWEKIVDGCTINTNFENAKIVNYTVQISAIKNNSANWLTRLNNEVSFPVRWHEEQYVNATENSSINSQNLMGYPKVNKKIKTKDIEVYNSLKDLKKDIYYGHIERHKSQHYRYFIDTETYIKRINKSQSDLCRLKKWMSKIKPKIARYGNINIIITPNAKIQSDFVETVNDSIFGGNSLIIYLDAFNWRYNIIQKLSYISQIYDNNDKDVKFHYIDHALHTGEMYRKTKSYMKSILKNSDKFSFSSIITIINRLSFDRNKEIKSDVGDNLFSYVNLFIPPSKDPEKDCSLCLLIKHYNKLSRNTIIESCNNVIIDELSKIKIRSFGLLTENCNSREQNEKYSNLKPQSILNKQFMKMILTHEIFHIFSETSQNYTIPDNHEILTQELDNLYNGKYKSNLDKLYNDNILTTKEIYTKNINQYKKNTYDFNKKISFLKVISSPPLSQYIIIREYAHIKLLSVLADILPKVDNGNYTISKEKYSYSDLIMVKAILKSLSFLKSNSLVRKDVIIGAWIVCFKTMEGLFEETKELRNNIHEVEQTLKKIKNIEKLQEDMFEKEKEKKQIEIIEEDKLEINRLLKKLNKGESLLLEEFKCHFEFYIKNASFEDEAKALFLGEILRCGNEPKLPLLVDFKISKTIASNAIFKQFANYKNHYNYSYKEFLIWLFYDNTTIIRKTLINFRNELNKNKQLNEFFYKDKELIEFDAFVENIAHIVKSFEDIVKKEYYYSNFKYYLLENDENNLIKKLVHVLYVQEFMRILNANSGKKNIDKDMGIITKVFATIMDADVTFLVTNKEVVLKNKKKIYIYPIASYENMSISKKSGINLDRICSSNNFHVSKILKQKHIQFEYPLIIKYNIDKYGEGSEFQNKHLAHFLLYDNSLKKTNLVGTITFLYSSEFPTKNEFRTKIQESGRLLLLLKDELEKYVINYLINEKALDLWIKEKESQRKFDKIYKGCNHNFLTHEITNEIDFDELDEDNFIKVRMSYFSHTNKIINHLYSSIKPDSNNNDKNILKLQFSSEPINNMISDIFNEKFCNLLQSYVLHKHWSGNLKIDHHKLDSKSKTTFNKQILRAFVVQCLDNAFDKHLTSTHKDVQLEINKNLIMIKSHTPRGFDNSAQEKFKEKQKSIKALYNLDYSCMTLTSLQAYCDKFGFICNYYFDKYSNFITKIGV